MATKRGLSSNGITVHSLRIYRGFIRTSGDAQFAFLFIAGELIYSVRIPVTRLINAVFRVLWTVCWSVVRRSLWYRGTWIVWWTEDRRTVRCVFYCAAVGMFKLLSGNVPASRFVLNVASGECKMQATNSNRSLPWMNKRLNVTLPLSVDPRGLLFTTRAFDIFINPSRTRFVIV